MTTNMIWKVEVMSINEQVIGASPLCIKYFKNESDADNFISNPLDNMKYDIFNKSKINII